MASYDLDDRSRQRALADHGPGTPDGAWIAANLAETAGEWSPDGTVVVDPSGNIRYANQSLERVMGFHREVVAGSPVWDFVHPDDLLAAAGALNEASRSAGYHYPVEVRIRRADDRWAECEVNGTTIEATDGSWIILSVRVSSDRDEVMGRRRRIEQLVRMASLECSVVEWRDVDMLVGRFLGDLSAIVGAELVELAWQEERGAELLVQARWPRLPRSSRGADADLVPFQPVWALDGDGGRLLHFSSELDSLPASPIRDRFLRLGTQAVAEIPLSAGAPSVVFRMAFGDAWHQWDDANIDLVTLLVDTLTATLRRCHAESHLHTQARTDPLTGLLNRTELYRRFGLLLEGRDADGQRGGYDGFIGVLYGDLDSFKQVNDRFGHAVGDQLLEEVADALRASVRDVDLVARFGGDEFVVVCPQMESPEALNRVVERISQAVGALDAQGVPARMSIGASIAAVGVDADEVVRLADEAMYRSKPGRGQSPAPG